MLISLLVRSWLRPPRGAALLLTLVVASPAVAHAQGAPAAPVRPGDDFFGFANRAWLDTASIPAGRVRWGARNEIDTLTKHQLDRVFDDVTRPGGSSSAVLVGNFLAAYQDSTGIEARGLAPIRAALDSIDHLRDKTALARALGADVAADVDPRNLGIFQSGHILGLSVDIGQHGEPNYRTYLVQGGLGLPDRENYLGTDPKLLELRGEYHRYLVRLFSAARFSEPDRRATGVLNLETFLARAQASREASANDFNADSAWSRADFARRAPGMDWRAFLTAAGLGAQDTLVAWQPTALVGLAGLVGSEPLEVWKDYLRARLLDRYADVLPASFAAPALAFRGEVSGVPDARSRSERARAAAQVALSDAIGRLYVERFFPAAEKARVEGIVQNVIAAFRARVPEAEWMSPRSRMIATTKLTHLRFEVGYPERWPDLSDLRIAPNDPVGDLRRVEAHNYRVMLARIGRPVDQGVWQMPAQKAGGLLNFQLNTYNFAAALLQATKFDINASDAYNYGAIGAIVGHETSHYVDQLGADYDATGAFAHWWTADDEAGFQRAADRLGRQVAAYDLGGGRSIDPKRTQVENVADLGGLMAALDAFHATLGPRLADTAYVHAQDRDFFLGFARSWRGLIADSALARVLATDAHAPERYRAAIVRNLDAWYAAFDVRPGTALYLAPADRVRIW